MDFGLKQNGVVVGVTRGYGRVLEVSHLLADQLSKKFLITGFYVRS